MNHRIISSLSQRTLLLIALGLAFLSPRTHATTLAPIGFKEQVTSSDAVIRGEVLSSTSKVVDTPDGQVIMTFTKVKTIETFSGKAEDEIELQTLGGTVHGVQMNVDGMPKLKTGSEYVLFIKENGKTICPLVGWNNGAREISNSWDGTTFLELPYLLMGEAQKTLGMILETARKTAGNASLDVANMMLSNEKVEKLKPDATPTDAATVTLDQFRNLVQFYTK